MGGRFSFNAVLPTPLVVLSRAEKGGKHGAAATKRVTGLSNPSHGRAERAALYALLTRLLPASSTTQRQRRQRELIMSFFGQPPRVRPCYMSLKPLRPPFPP